MSEQTDSEKIAVLLDRSERLEKAILGNGRPGLIHEVALLKEQMEDIDKRAPTRKEKYGTIVAVLAALITGLWDKVGK